jgi:hypothetical protein
MVANPEGIDYIIYLEHTKFFSKEEFKKICLQIIVDNYTELMKKVSCSYISREPDNDEILERFKKAGFVLAENCTASFCFDPWMFDNHHNIRVDDEGDSPDVEACLKDVEKFNDMKQQENP